MVGVKIPLKQRQIWAIRFYLDRGERTRNRALFDLAIDRKLWGCDLIKIRNGTLVSELSIRDTANGGSAENRSPSPIRDHS